MRALSLLRPGELTISTIPEPVVLPGDLLLQVEMVGLCGTDLNSFRGLNPLIHYPRVLGHEIAATVLTGNEEIPAGTRVTVSPYTSCGICSSCRRGRMNACIHNQTLGVQRDGAITERIAVPSGKIYPSNLDLRSLCLVEPLTVGFHAVRRGRVRETDTVVVFGCGGIGLGAIAGSTFAGARTIAIDVDEGKLEIARKVGAAEVFNSRTGDVRSYLREITGGDGPDVVIEAIGLSETFQLAVETVAFTGRVVYIGYAKEPVAYETKYFVQKELDILGSRNALPEDFQNVMTMLNSGRFPVDDTISAVVSLDEGPEILKKWSGNASAFTKIMIGLR